jgi:uncharacterized protein YdbL (DUF1318 family)
MTPIFNVLKGKTRAVVLGTALALAALPATAILGAVPALADLASDKAAVDAAKAAGTVGEQADGYLGFVKGSADAATTAAVADINAARRVLYANTATKSGVTPEAAAQATGAQLLGKVPPGEYFKPLDGGWTKK